MTILKPLALGLSLVFAAPAFADPSPKDIADIQREMAELTERMEALSKMLESAESSVRTEELAGGKRVHRLIDDPDTLRRAARDMEDALEEAEIFESLAELLIQFSEDVTVTESNDGLSLAFKGREMASMESDGDERMTLRAGGRKLTLEVE